MGPFDDVWTYRDPLTRDQQQEIERDFASSWRIAGREANTDEYREALELAINAAVQDARDSEVDRKPGFEW